MTSILADYCIPTDYFFLQVINELRIYKKSHYLTWQHSPFLQNIYRNILNAISDPANPSKKKPFPTRGDGEYVVNIIHEHGFMLLKLAPELHEMLYVFIRLREKKILQNKYDEACFDIEKLRREKEAQAIKPPIVIDDEDDEEEERKPVKRSPSPDVSFFYHEWEDEQTLVLPFPKKKPDEKEEEKEKQAEKEDEETKKKKTKPADDDEDDGDDDDDGEEEDPGWSWLFNGTPNSSFTHSPYSR